MILYFSGRYCGNYDIPSRPETIMKKDTASIMMSYRYAKKEDIKRLENLVKSRRKAKNESK